MPFLSSCKRPLTLSELAQFAQILFAHVNAAKHISLHQSKMAMHYGLDHLKVMWKSVGIWFYLRGYFIGHWTLPTWRAEMLPNMKAGKWPTLFFRGLANFRQYSRVEKLSKKLKPIRTKVWKFVLCLSLPSSRPKTQSKPYQLKPQIKLNPYPN